MKICLLAAELFYADSLSDRQDMKLIEPFVILRKRLIRIQYTPQRTQSECVKEISRSVLFRERAGFHCENQNT